MPMLTTPAFSGESVGTQGSLRYSSISKIKDGHVGLKIGLPRYHPGQSKVMLVDANGNYLVLWYLLKHPFCVIFDWF